MKYYTVQAVTNSKTIKVNKHFSTRDEAINYIFKLLPYNTQVEEEINKGNHNIEYICNNHSRFSISRQIAA